MIWVNNQFKSIKRFTVIGYSSFNELYSLKKILKKLSKKYKLIVIDDGSKDSTSKMLNAFKIESITNKKNIGYEKSLKKGFTSL